LDRSLPPWRLRCTARPRAAVRPAGIVGNSPQGAAHILLHRLPADYGLDSHRWTGRRAQSLIGQKWEKATVAGRLAEIAGNPARAGLKGIKLEFLHTPPYSPAFNPAECLIHLVRQDALYHLPCTFTLQDKAGRVQELLAQGPPLTPKQMGNLLRHFGNLPRSGKTVKSWPKLE
jgi:hypothetical protein